MADRVVQVKVKGIKQLSDGARELFEDIERATDEQATAVTADQAAQITRARVPKRTGRLAGSVRVAERGRVRQVQMGAGLPYARWIEYGGGRGRPYRRSGRYVYPVARRTARAFRKHAENAASGAIRRMRWPTPR